VAARVLAANDCNLKRRFRRGRGWPGQLKEADRLCLLLQAMVRDGKTEPEHNGHEGQRRAGNSDCRKGSGHGGGWLRAAQNMEEI